MKALRCLTVAVAAMSILGLTACNAFLAAPMGRWNLADPKMDEPRESLVATVDGHVESGGPKFFDPLMRVGNTNDMIILLKFDTAKIPTNVVQAALELYLVSLVGSIEIKVSVIVQDWDPNTILRTIVTTPGFSIYLTTPSVVLESGLTLPRTISLDVTKYIQSISPGSIKGFKIEQWMPMTYTAEMATTRSAGLPKPTLKLWAPAW